jgi:hypothetical protein
MNVCWTEVPFRLQGVSAGRTKSFPALNLHPPTDWEVGTVAQCSLPYTSLHNFSLKNYPTWPLKSVNKPPPECLKKGRLLAGEIAL